MDDSFRDLEREAELGDEEALELLNAMKCRAFGHDWKTRDKVISTFPIQYETIKEYCKRCGEAENPIIPHKAAKKVSAIERLLHRYAYGSFEEMQREYNRLLDE